MSSTTSTTSPRKRCELACRPCRHRKIKCHTSNPGGPCDSCVSKGKSSECEFVPVSEDYPPPRPRQSSPNTPHSYSQMSRVSPIRTEYANSSTGGLPSASYFQNYTPYDSTQHPPPPSHHSPSPPTAFAMSPQQGFGYPPASSPTQSMPPVSPVYEDYKPTGLPGLPGPEDYISQVPHGTHQWNSQPQMAYGVGPSYMTAPVGWPNPNQQVLQLQQQDNSMQPYSNTGEQPLQYPYQPQDQQYNTGHYYSQ